MAEVRIIYLPPGQGAKKQGVDDYLAAGHTVDELLSHATTKLKNPPSGDEDDQTPFVPYRATAGGLVWDKPTHDGTSPIPLTNFNATILADLSEDDGAELKRHFEIEARLGTRAGRFAVPADRFAQMGWATEHLGASAVVYPGFGARDHARTAVQLLSTDITERSIYTHTGWREIGGAWLYLHGGGAIGKEGAVEGVEVRLDGALSSYRLPKPSEGKDLERAIRASLETWEVAPDGLVIPQHAAAYRAAMGETDFSVHVTGPTGEGKSAVAALFLRHYGADLDDRNLISWESTENALEAQAFVLKDSLVVFDDFAPSGNPYDVQRWHRKADRVLRAKGNASGRARMRADLSIKAPKPPRALILSTGEDTPNGQSLRARMLVLEHGKGDVDWEKLSSCQRDAGAGLYAGAMAAFARWLAGHARETRGGMPEEARALRDEAALVGQHKRTPGIAAGLGLGLRYFLRFAQEAGGMTAEEAGQLWERGWWAIRGAAASQKGHHDAGEPTRRFRDLLSAAIASGRAHLAATDGEKPEVNANALGWRRSGGEYAEWRPQGDRVGWVKGDDLFLEPEASHRVAQQQAQGGEGLAISARTLRKRLKEKGVLASTDESRETLTVRRTIEGVKDRGVLHLRLGSLFSHDARPDEPDDSNVSSRTDRNPSGDPAPGRPKSLREPDATPDAARAPARADGGRDRRDRRVLERPEESRSAEYDEVEDSVRRATPKEHELIDGADRLEQLVTNLRGSSIVAVDLETTGLNPRRDSVRLISLSTGKGTWLIDCFEVDPRPLFPVLAEKKLVFHNAVFDLGFLAKMGFELKGGEAIATMLMSKVTENGTHIKREEAA